MANSNSWIQKFRKVEKGEHMFVIDHRRSDIYKYYLEKYPKKMDVTTFNKLCQAFNIRLSNEIITKSFIFKLPYRLGNLSIITKKHKIVLTEEGKIDTVAMAIDWPGSRKMWQEEWPELTMKEILAIPHKKLLVYTNEHSNGYIMRWFWDKRLSNVKNQFSYIFKPVKGQQDKEYYKGEDVLYYGRRGLAHWIRNEDRTNEYFVQ